MLDIRFEIAGRKLDPCFIGDSVEKATLLYVARLMKRKFSVIRITDQQDPLRVLVKGDDVDHLRYELEGSKSVLDQIRDKMGVSLGEEIVLTS